MGMLFENLINLFHNFIFRIWAERDSTQSLCNSPSQELHCHMLPTFIIFTHLQVCSMSTHLPNNIVQVCVNDVARSNCNVLSWLNVYILLHSYMCFIDEWVAWPINPVKHSLMGEDAWNMLHHWHLSYLLQASIRPMHVLTQVSHV